MDEADLRLDGNAAAGLLQELLAFELTAAQLTCDGCGAVAAMAAGDAYTQAPGVVLRCRACERVLMRTASANGRRWLDLRGVRCLEVRV